MGTNTYASKYSTYKRLTTSSEMSYASHQKRSSYHREMTSEYSNSKGVSSMSKEVVSGTDSRSLPVYIAIKDYKPDDSDKDGLPLDEGQIVEVLDSKNMSSWLVRTKGLSNPGAVRAGTVIRGKHLVIDRTDDLLGNAAIVTYSTNRYEI
ncbi:unnamed protein product [Soboliphyme baturini]|uniref:SH3 domain-containing protein n=1 Tax=Soboliphyme baturini TaxID=241478 RepID=A0A183IKS1_9BILA|nr:unnamed protein product [Soboliphyme baturini]